MSTQPTPRFLARLVMLNELRALVRDRRAMFSAFALPFLIYPLFLLAQTKLDKAAREGLETKAVEYALAFEEGELGLGDELWSFEDLEERFGALLSLEGPCSTESVDVSEDWSPEVWREAEEDDERVLVHVSKSTEQAGRALFELYFIGSDDLANESKRRARDAFKALRETLESKRLDALLEIDPGAAMRFESVDVASSEDQSGAALGRLLPLLLVLSILAGGAMAALAAFAGERENGTLETLLVQPAPSASLAWGKFAVVVITALGSLLANGSSLLMCAALGIESKFLPEGTLSPDRLALALLLFMPALFLLCAALTYVSSRARTFREGQQTLMPLTLIAALPSAAALLPSADFNAIAAVVPIAGPALALRDALTGNLNAGTAAWMFAINSVWAVLVLRGIGGVLEAERLLRSVGNSLEAAKRQLRARVGLRWGFLAVFLVYVVGGALQARNLLSGLLLTLWVLLPILTWLCARGLAREEGWRAALGTGAPEWSRLLGALLAAPGLALLMHRLFEFQETILPQPQAALDATGAMSAITDLPWFVALLVLAVSPGLCEEFLFRGAVLQALKRDLSAIKIVAWQALLFGLVHLSVYRFLPTALLGALLATITLRSKTIWAAIALHIAYNSCAFLGGMVREGELTLDFAGPLDSYHKPLAAAAGAFGLFLLLRGTRKAASRPL